GLVFVGEGEVVSPGSCPCPLVGPFVAVAAALVAVGAVAPPKPDKAAAAPGTPSDRRLGLTYVAATSAPADAVPRSSWRRVVCVTGRRLVSIPSSSMPLSRLAMRSVPGLVPAGPARP